MGEAIRRSFWRLGEIMVQKDWITWTQLAKALAAQQVQKQPIGQILVQQGAVSVQQVYRALAFQHNVEFVELKKICIEEEAVGAVPKRCAYEHKVMPLERTKDTLLVATSNPVNHWAKAVLYRTTGIPNIRSVLACPDDIHDVMIRHYGLERDAA